MGDFMSFLSDLPTPISVPIPFPVPCFSSCPYGTSPDQNNKNLNSGLMNSILDSIFHKMYSRLQKSCNKQTEQWKTTIDLLHMNLIIFPASADLPLGSNPVNQLWFSTVQLACCKTFAICCNCLSIVTFFPRHI